MGTDQRTYEIVSTHKRMREYRSKSGYRSGTGYRLEPSCGKTNHVVSEQVRHKPACTAVQSQKKARILKFCI